MQEIQNRYGDKDSTHLFPVIRDASKNVRQQYRSMTYFIDRKLKKSKNGSSLASTCQTGRNIYTAER